MAWDENKKIKFIIDHNKIDDTLYDFPVTIKLSDSCGIANVDLTTTSGTTASGTIFEEATSALSPDYGFTGTDGDGPDWRQWYFGGINAQTYCSIQSNKLNYYSDTACDCYIYSNYELVGDFDVQVDFDLVTHPETNNWSLHFYLSGSNHGCYIIREYAGSTNRYRTGFYTPAGGSGGGATTSLDHITGKLRWVRTGGTVYVYYWTGSWVLMSTSPWSDCTEPMRLLLRLWQDSGPSLVEYNMDNVQLNSGSVRWDHIRSKMAVFAGGDQNTGTRCFIDLEKCNTLTEEIVMHVGVPEISHTEDTELYLYYDEDNNTNATGYPFSWWASLTPEDASDNFSVDGTPNPALWYDRYPGSYVQDGRLVMDLSSGNTYDNLDSTYTIYGDFDIQVDFDIGTAPTTDGWMMGLLAWEANEDLTDKRWFIRRRYTTANGHHYDSGYNDGGGWTFANTATTSGSGKLRITREDHVVKTYYYDAGWQSVQTATLTSLDNVPMRIKLEGQTYTGEPTASVYFDNFTVNKAFIITDNYLASDTFVGPDYSQPNREKWRKLHGETAKFVIKDNSLYVNDSGATSAGVYNTHWLDGNFDVQVDFNLVTWPSLDVGYAYMRFIGRDDNNDYMNGYIGRRYEVSRGGNVYFTSFYDNSSWTGETNTATSDTSGKLRFYRDGNTIYAQYWNGASWVTTDSEDFDSAPEVMIYLQAGSSHSTGVEVKYDNFKVNSARRIRGYTSGANVGSAAQVWDHTYRFVCHLGEIYDDPTSGYSDRVYDGSYWHNRGTATSNMTYSDKVDSQVGGGFEFDGTDDQIAFSPYAWNSWRFDRPHAIEAVIKCNSAGAGSSRAIFTRMDVGGGYPGYDFRVIGDGRLSSYVVASWSGDAIQLYGQTPNLHDDEYHYVAVRYDGSKDETGYTFYYDGQVVPNVYNVNTLTSDTATYNSNVSIGSRDETADFFYGVIDEVRASYGGSTTLRPDAHFKTSYFSLFDDLLYIDWLPGPQGFDANKYIQFFVDHRRIDDMVSNFPIRFRISKQSGIDNIDITRIFDELSYAARKKIAVTTADGLTQCYVEIENWDDSRQEANLWIKAPSISPQQQTEFYLYYDSTADDNTDWVGDTGDVAAQNVWDDNFMAVYHFSEITSKDSTGNYDATPNGIDSSNLSDGRSGEAFHLNGADEYVTQATLFDTVPANGTVSILFKSDVDSAGTDLTLFTKANDESGGAIDMLRFFWNADDIVGDRYMRVLKYNNNNLITLETPDDIDGSKFYLVSTTWGSAGAELYLDGDLVDSDVDTNPFGNGTTRDFAVGMYNWGGTPSQYWDGQIDEVRVSNKQRTASWEKATYHTLFDDMIYFRMPWDDTHSEIKLTVSGTLINEDLTNFPLTLTLASGVGTNTEDVTKIFDGLTLSGTLGYSDDFTGWDGDVPDPLLWTTVLGSPQIKNNKLNLEIVDPIEDTVESLFTISGDFDIQIDYDLVTYPATDAWLLKFEARIDADNRISVARGYTGSSHKYISDGFEGGVYSGNGTSATADTSGKFRLARSGSVGHAYYYNAGWQELGTGLTIGTGPITVKTPCASYSSAPDAEANFDNFVVVSGTVHANQTRKKIAIFSGGDQHTGDKCFVEIEHWDAVNETAALHVQVPTLTSGTDTDLYLYEDINQPDQDYRLISEANDTFTAASGSAPDHTRWREDANTNYFEIQNNKLYASYSGVNKWLRSRYRIEGNFEIQTDWEVLLGPSTNSWRVGFWITQEGTDGNRDYGLIYRGYESSTHYLAGNFRDGGAWVGTTTAASTATSGKFRIRRISNDMYVDYDIGGGWVNLKSQTFGDAPAVQVIMEANSYTGNPSVIGTWDNFTVTSGTVTGFVGDTGETPAGEVWDQNFVGVWHMAQEPSGSDDILDSKAVEWNIADGTSQNMEAADLKDSQVGKALEFDGTAEWVDMDDFASADPGTGELTVEILAKRNASGIDDYFVSKGNVNSTLEGWSIWQENSTNALYVRCNASDDSSQRASQSLSGGILDTNWHTVALVLDHTDEKIYGYKDGSNSGWAAGGGGPANDNITSFDIDTTDELAVAAARDAASTSRYANATIDEVRISSTARTPGWIYATHVSLFDGLVFYDLLEPAPPAPPEPPTPSGLNDAAGWTSINDVLTSGIVVRLYRRLDGELVGEDISATTSGTWNIPTTYDELHYAIALYPVSGTNALIYDWLEPTTV